MMKFMPGVDRNKTPVLNQAAISVTQLMRQMPDRNGFGLWQKLGGWRRYYPTAMPSIVRALWAWSDTNDHRWLAVGCETSATPLVGASLFIIHDGVELLDVTPIVREDNVAVAVDTTIGSNIAAIADPGASVTDFDVVYIPAHISVGGIIIFGLYSCVAVSPDTFEIYVINKFGNPYLATSTVVNGGAVATFTTTLDSSIVTVHLADHAFQVGDTFPILLPTMVGGIELAGDYIVQEVVDVDNFTILGSSQATLAEANIPINGGLARYEFFLSSGPLATGTGYGIGGYGRGGYGRGVTPLSPTGARIETDDWVFDNWGDLLIACPVVTNNITSSGHSPVHGGPLFYWSPTSRPDTPQLIANAPPVNDGFFIAMPQRQIICWGSTFTGIQDHLLVRWCDVDNFNVWIGTPTNQAGSRRLSRGSRIISGIQLGLQGLLITDVGAWTMQFISGQGVYSIQEVARGCGCIGRKALGTLNQTAYWMGAAQFFTMGDGGVAPMPCPIWDLVFRDIYPGTAWKIRFFANSLFNEIGWYYASARGGGEVDSYVKNNVLMPPGQGWDYGTLDRTAWIDQSVLGGPIAAGAQSRLIYEHETSNDADGQAMLPVMRTGYFVLTEADVLMFVDQVWPDFKWGVPPANDATVYLKFYVTSYPNEPDEVHGPFTLTNAVKYVTPRFRGRLVSLEFYSTDVGTTWRVGGTRYRVQPDGKFK
jgi:hypothetical protein